MRRAAVPLLFTLAAFAFADDRTPLNPDQNVKSICGFGLERPIATLEICQTAGYAAAYAKAIANGAGYCKNAFKCTDGSNVFYAPLRGLDACQCTANTDLGGGGGWQAYCDLDYQGICGCQSPSVNPDPGTIEINLTPEETQMLAAFYPRISTQLTAKWKPEPAADRAREFAAFTDAIRNYHHGRAFQVALSSRQGGSTAVISMAAPFAERTPGAVATITMSADGAVRIAANTKVPGGVARGLSTAIAEAQLGQTEQ